MGKDFSGGKYRTADDVTARQEYNSAAFFSYHLLEILDRFNLYEYSNNYNNDPITLIYLQLSTLRSIFRLSSIELSGNSDFLKLQTKLRKLVTSSRTISINSRSGDIKFYPSKIKKLFEDTEDVFREIIYLINQHGLILKVHNDPRDIMGKFE